MHGKDTSWGHRPLLNWEFQQPYQSRWHGNLSARWTLAGSICPAAQRRRRVAWTGIASGLAWREQNKNTKHGSTTLAATNLGALVGGDGRVVQASLQSLLVFSSAHIQECKVAELIVSSMLWKYVRVRETLERETATLRTRERQTRETSKEGESYVRLHETLELINSLRNGRSTICSVFISELIFVEIIDVDRPELRRSSILRHLEEQWKPTARRNRHLRKSAELCVPQTVAGQPTADWKRRQCACARAKTSWF